MTCLSLYCFSTKRCLISTERAIFLWVDLGTGRICHKETGGLESSNLMAREFLFLTTLRKCGREGHIKHLFKDRVYGFFWESMLGL